MKYSGSANPPLRNTMQSACRGAFGLHLVGSRLASLYTALLTIALMFGSQRLNAQERATPPADQAGIGDLPLSDDAAAWVARFIRELQLPDQDESLRVLMGEFLRWQETRGVAGPNTWDEHLKAYRKHLASLSFVDAVIQAEDGTLAPWPKTIYHRAIVNAQDASKESRLPAREDPKVKKDFKAFSELQNINKERLIRNLGKIALCEILGRTTPGQLNEWRDQFRALPGRETAAGFAATRLVVPPPGPAVTSPKLTQLLSAKDEPDFNQLNELLFELGVFTFAHWNSKNPPAIPVKEPLDLSESAELWTIGLKRNDPYVLAAGSVLSSAWASTARRLKDAGTEDAKQEAAQQDFQLFSKNWNGGGGSDAGENLTAWLSDLHQARQAGKALFDFLGNDEQLSALASLLDDLTGMSKDIKLDQETLDLALQIAQLKIRQMAASADGARKNLELLAQLNGKKRGRKEPVQQLNELTELLPENLKAQFKIDRQPGSARFSQLRDASLPNATQVESKHDFLNDPLAPSIQTHSLPKNEEIASLFDTQSQEWSKRFSFVVTRVELAGGAGSRVRVLGTIQVPQPDKGGAALEIEVSAFRSGENKWRITPQSARFTGPTRLSIQGRSALLSDLIVNKDGRMHCRGDLPGGTAFDIAIESGTKSPSVLPASDSPHKWPGGIGSIGGIPASVEVVGENVTLRGEFTVALGLPELIRCRALRKIDGVWEAEVQQPLLARGLDWAWLRIAPHPSATDLSVAIVDAWLGSIQVDSTETPLGALRVHHISWTADGRIVGEIDLSTLEQRRIGLGFEISKANPTSNWVVKWSHRKNDEKGLVKAVLAYAPFETLQALSDRNVSFGEPVVTFGRQEPAIVVPLTLQTKAIGTVGARVRIDSKGLRVLDIADSLRPALRSLGEAQLRQMLERVRSNETLEKMIEGRQVGRLGRVVQVTSIGPSNRDAPTDLRVTFNTEIGSGDTVVEIIGAAIQLTPPLRKENSEIDENWNRDVKDFAKWKFAFLAPDPSQTRLRLNGRSLSLEEAARELTGGASDRIEKALQPVAETLARLGVQPELKVEWISPETALSIDPKNDKEVMRLVVSVPPGSGGNRLPVATISVDLRGRVQCKIDITDDKLAAWAQIWFDHHAKDGVVSAGPLTFGRPTVEGRPSRVSLPLKLHLPFASVEGRVSGVKFGNNGIDLADARFHADESELALLGSRLLHQLVAGDPNGEVVLSLLEQVDVEHPVFSFAGEKRVPTLHCDMHPRFSIAGTPIDMQLKGVRIDAAGRVTVQSIDNLKAEEIVVNGISRAVLSQVAKRLESQRVVVDHQTFMEIERVQVVGGKDWAVIHIRVVAGAVGLDAKLTLAASGKNVRLIEVQGDQNINSKLKSLVASLKPEMIGKWAELGSSPWIEMQVTSKVEAVGAYVSNWKDLAQFEFVTKFKLKLTGDDAAPEPVRAAAPTDGRLGTITLRGFPLEMKFDLAADVEKILSRVAEGELKSQADKALLGMKEKLNTALTKMSFLGASAKLDGELSLAPLKTGFHIQPFALLLSHQDLSAPIRIDRVSIDSSGKINHDGASADLTPLAEKVFGGLKAVNISRMVLEGRHARVDAIIRFGSEFNLDIQDAVVSLEGDPSQALLAALSGSLGGERRVQLADGVGLALRPRLENGVVSSEFDVDFLGESIPGTLSLNLANGKLTVGVDSARVQARLGKLIRDQIQPLIALTGDQDVLTTFKVIGGEEHIPSGIEFDLSIPLPGFSDGARLKGEGARLTRAGFGWPQVMKTEVSSGKQTFLGAFEVQKLNLEYKRGKSSHVGGDVKLALSDSFVLDGSLTVPLTRGARMSFGGDLSILGASTTKVKVMIDPSTKSFELDLKLELAKSFGFEGGVTFDQKNSRFAGNGSGRVLGGKMMNVALELDFKQQVYGAKAIIDLQLREAGGGVKVMAKKNDAELSARFPWSIANIDIVGSRRKIDVSASLEKLSFLKVTVRFPSIDTINGKRIEDLLRNLVDPTRWLKALLNISWPPVLSPFSPPGKGDGTGSGDGEDDSGEEGGEGEEPAVKLPDGENIGLDGAGDWYVVRKDQTISVHPIKDGKVDLTPAAQVKLDKVAKADSGSLIGDSFKVASVGDGATFLELVSANNQEQKSFLIQVDAAAGSWQERVPTAIPSPPEPLPPVPPIKPEPPSEGAPELIESRPGTAIVTRKKEGDYLVLYRDGTVVAGIPYSELKRFFLYSVSTDSAKLARVVDREVVLSRYRAPHAPPYSNVVNQSIDKNLVSAPSGDNELYNLANASPRSLLGALLGELAWNSAQRAELYYAQPKGRQYVLMIGDVDRKNSTDASLHFVKKEKDGAVTLTSPFLSRRSWRQNANWFAERKNMLTALDLMWDQVVPTSSTSWIGLDGDHAFLSEIGLGGDDRVARFWRAKLSAGGAQIVQSNAQVRKVLRELLGVLPADRNPEGIETVTHHVDLVDLGGDVALLRAHRTGQPSVTLLCPKWQLPNRLMHDTKIGNLGEPVLLTSNALDKMPPDKPNAKPFYTGLYAMLSGDRSKVAATDVVGDEWSVLVLDLDRKNHVHQGRWMKVAGPSETALSIQLPFLRVFGKNKDASFFTKDSERLKQILTLGRELSGHKSYLNGIAYISPDGKVINGIAYNQSKDELRRCTITMNAGVADAPGRPTVLRKVLAAFSADEARNAGQAVSAWTGVTDEVAGNLWMKLTSSVDTSIVRRVLLLQTGSDGTEEPFLFEQSPLSPTAAQELPTIQHARLNALSVNAFPVDNAEIVKAMTKWIVDHRASKEPWQVAVGPGNGLLMIRHQGLTYVSVPHDPTGRTDFVSIGSTQLDDLWPEFAKKEVGDAFTKSVLKVGVNKERVLLAVSVGMQQSSNDGRAVAWVFGPTSASSGGEYDSFIRHASGNNDPANVRAVDLAAKISKLQAEGTHLEARYAKRWVRLVTQQPDPSTMKGDEAVIYRMFRP